MGAQRYEIYLRVFKLDISRVSAVNKWNIELEHKKINSYLQASMYYFVHYNKHFTQIQKKIVGIADWLKLDINTCEKLSYQNTCADTIFLSGGNPYNTLEFI
jgi:CRISPR/Cas system-associated protein Csx1